MFRGAAQLVLDNKGRLAIPAKYREAIAERSQGRMVLTADPSRCLLLYPLPDWEPIQARLMSLSSFNEQIRALQRLLVGHADDVELDASGRILVPPTLRQFAMLERDVVVSGQGNRLELWDQVRWNQQTDLATGYAANGTPSELDGFSL